VGRHPRCGSFLNAHCAAIDQREWPRDRWHAVLRACDIRPRKFYATRHTFISTALTAGLNVKFISEYTGTSLDMIEKRYARFLEAPAVEAQDAIPMASQKRHVVGSRPADL
jgi:integrase